MLRRHCRGEGALPGAELVRLAGTVFLPDELEQEEVKDQDEETYGRPEEGGQAAQFISVSMKGQDVMLVRGG